MRGGGPIDYKVISSNQFKFFTISPAEDVFSYDSRKSEQGVLVTPF
jgi:hypothetical protein